MTKIREIIDISSGYTSYVDLFAEYNDPEDNQERMRRYRPIKAHRLAFEKIANALNPRDRRFYFLSGSYGTGKSHLLLMLANYFSKPSDHKEMEDFFQGYKQAQDQVMLKSGEVLQERSAASLKALRSSGHFLVAICNFDWNLDFEGAVIRSVEEAFEREGITSLLDSHYQEALRRLQDWEERKTEAPFYNRFTTALSNKSDYTLDELLEGLKGRKESALEIFRLCFSEATDTDFSYDKDNLRDILRDILSSDNFKSRFRGIVILYDEFGYALDDGLVNLSKLHGFAQFCANSGMETLPLIFIGSGHKPFRNHGKVSDSVHYNTLAARVNEIALQTQGMEDIISAIVHPKKDHPAWVNEVSPHNGIFTWFSGACKRLGLFNWLPAPKINKNIIENIYPMHPLATFAVLRLAEEAGSDNRSVFKFFSPEFESGESGWKNVQDYSFPWFIENNQITENGKLNLYTADRLVDYFRDSLTTDNNKLIDRIKSSIVNFEATLRALNQHIERTNQEKLIEDEYPLVQRILRVMLINEIISNEQVQIINTFENICFSLFAIDDQEKDIIKNRLNYLCKNAIIFKNDKSVYELMQGDRKDIQRLVDQFKANPANRPSNLLESFLDLNPLKADEIFLEAKDYNLTYNEDKRLKVVFATPPMIEKNYTIGPLELDFFSYLEHQRKDVGVGSDGYEGTAVYVFCENEGDIDQANKLFVKNQQKRVTLALPKDPFHIFDAIFTLNALNNLRQSKDYETFGPLEMIQMKNLREAASDVLDQAKSYYFSNKNVIWYGNNGKRIPVQENKSHDVANLMMEDLFVDRRNTFPHPEFNRIHSRLSGNSLSLLRHAGDILLDLSKTVRIDWGWRDNIGGNFYLRRCFVDNQVLKILDSQGDIRFFKAEENVAKFDKQIPAYAQMLKDLAAQEDKGPILFNEFIHPYYEDFGQGVIALTLMLLMARRYYGDGLRFKHQQDALTDLRFNNTDEVIDLVKGDLPNAVILFETVSKEDQDYFESVFRIFSSEQVKADREYGISDAYDAVYSWWEGLPAIAKSNSFHDPEFESFYHLLGQINTKDPFNFIKHDLLQVLDIIPGEKITKGKLSTISDRLLKFKEATENILAQVQNRILTEVKEIFNANDVLEYDIREAILDWYTNQLTPIQKDTFSKFHNDDSKPLIAEIRHLESTSEFLFKDLPVSYGLRSVQNWSTDLIDDYLNKIKRGKKHIEENTPDIPDLVLDLSEYDEIIRDKANEIRETKVNYRGELKIQVATENQKGHIYFTENGSDPSEESNSRQILSQNEELEIKGNKQLKFVVVDDEGNSGLVTTINAINELDKYKISRPKQMSLGDEFVNFVFPIDKQSADITLSSLIEELEKTDWMNLSEIKELVRNIIESREQHK